MPKQYIQYKQRHYFRLPNFHGILRYCLPNENDIYPKPGDYVRTYECPQLFIKRRQKKSMIRLGLWNAQNGSQCVICADFDKLPEDFETWKGFRKFLKPCLSDKALVITSGSGKAKALFVVKCPRGKKMNSYIARETLSKILPYDIYEYADTNTISMSMTFLNGHQMSTVRNWLKEARVLDAADDFKQHRYCRSSYGIENFEQYLPKNKFRRYYIALLEILIGQKGLIDGFDLPVTKLSKEIGCSQPNAGNMLNRLIDWGILERTTDKFTKGYRARTYKATGKLREVLVSLYRAIQSIADTQYKPPIPVHVSDGCWHDIIWDQSRFYVFEPDLFVREWSKVPGIFQKDRWKKLFLAINNRLRYLNLPEIPYYREH